jgi:hypothetical protein
VDWEKVGSCLARPLLEMTEFFKKAKEYAPKIVSLISPLTTPSGPAAPSSKTPVPVASAPSTSTDPATEVA